MCLSKFVLFAKAILLLLLTGLLLPAPLLAHGGVGVQHLNNVPAGPFRVYVWSDPEPPQVGEYHVTVALTENVEGDSTGLAGGPVLDAVVTVELTHEESGETLSARATHDDALNKLFDEASCEPALQGNWSVRVSVLPPGCDTAQGSGEQQGGDSGLSCESEQVVSFQDEILPKAFPWRALLGGILSVLLIMGAVVLYWATKPPTAIEEPAPAKQQDPAPAGGHS